MLNVHAKLNEHRINCFEMYGFDILIDHNLKPWILEVNVCPSLCSSSPLDRKIKHTLLSDIFNLIGLIPYDKHKFNSDKKKQQAQVPNEKNNPTHFSKNINEI